MSRYIGFRSTTIMCTQLLFYGCKRLLVIVRSGDHQGKDLHKGTE